MCMFFVINFLRGDLFGTAVVYELNKFLFKIFKFYVRFIKGQSTPACHLLVKKKSKI